MPAVPRLIAGAVVCAAAMARLASPALAQVAQTVESLARQGFEVKAAFVSVTGNMFLALQKAEAIYVCRLDQPFSPSAPGPRGAPGSHCYQTR